MKTLIRLSFAMIIALAFASCGSEKQMTQPQQPTYQQPAQQKVQTQIPDEEEVPIYCIDEAKSDKEYFRELGIGNHVNKQSARDAALSSAKAMLKNRLGGVVKGISTDYSRTVAGQAQSDKVQRLMERELTQVVDKMLNDADNPCEKMTKAKDGSFNSYYVIEVSKNEMLDRFEKTVETLSKQEEYAIEWQREKFREHAQKYMEELNNKQ
ncbi:MAG: hypothetical protein IK004_10370 [Bacteroidales bacterium]|nr:hypothetical protein [Bacteroidales bacterium]